MITFLVEKIIHEAEYVTPICELPICDEAHWQKQNMELLYMAKNSGHFQIKEVNQYCVYDKSFYILNIRHNYDLVENNIWEHIPKNSKKIILENNIPIILWLPLECTSFITVDQWKKLVNNRNDAGFKNIKTIVYSICTYKTDWGCNLQFDEIYCDNLYFVQSTIFLAYYTAKQKIGNMSRLEVLKDKMCSIDEHDLNLKKYDFLSLNNAKRPNRTFLLQVLYSDKELWDNNIISSRHEVDNTDIINTIFLNTLRYDYDSIHDQEFKKFINKLNYGPPILNNSELVNSLYQLKQDIASGKVIYNKIQDNNHLQKLLYHLGKEIPQSPLTLWLSRLVLSWHKSTYTMKELDSSNNYFNEYWEKDWYLNTWFSLVTECFCYNDQFYHESPMITEKIIKPIINNHPFVVFGHSGSHRLLQDLGFKTFEKTLLDLPEDYTVGNTTFFERLYNLNKALVDFKNLDFSQKKIKYYYIKNNITHNYNHLITTDWFKVEYNKLHTPHLLPIPVNHSSIWGNT